MCQLVAGFVLLLGSIGLIGWNEFRYVRSLKLVLKVEDETSVSSCWPNARADLDKKPIVAYCAVEDPGRAWSGAAGGPAVQEWEKILGPIEGLEFRIEPEIYQYREEKQCRRTDSACEYSYTLEWSPTISTAYHCRPATSGAQAGECANAPADLGQGPRQFPEHLETTLTYSAERFTLGATQGETSDGAFVVDKDSKLFGLAIGYATRSPVPVEITETTRPAVEALFAALPPGTVRPAKDEGRLYWSKAQDVTPGDVRVTFSTLFLAPKTGFTVVALKDAGRLTAWDTQLDGEVAAVAWMEEGPLDLGEVARRQGMAEDARVWVFRALGLLCAFAGLWCLTSLEQTQLLPVVAHFLTGVVQWVLHAINFCVALMITLLVIGAAWAPARPLRGLALLAGALLAGGAAYSLQAKGRKRKECQDTDHAECEPLLVEVEAGTAGDLKPEQVPAAAA